MSKSEAVIVIVLVIAGAVYFSQGMGGGNGAGAISQAWVNQQLITWQPVSNSSIGFSAMFTGASYDNLLSGRTTNVENDLVMLLASGASCIRMDIGFDAWLMNNVSAQLQIASYVAQIKLAGKCLIIADASAESYRRTPLEWTPFKEAWVNRVQTLASLYHPNFYIVIKEPGWYAPMISDPSAAESASDIANLTKWLTNTVLAASPSTKVGVSVPGNALSKQLYANWFSYASSLQGISFLGVDNYAVGDYTETISFMNNQGINGKSLWVAEAGDSTTYPTNSTSQITLDVSWIQMLYFFGLYVHATNLVPFWTNGFSYYGNPPNYSLRSPFFYEYQTLATKYGGTVS